MARLIDKLPEFENTWQRLMKLKAGGRMAHAMVFSGQSHEAKLEMAWALAQALVCELKKPEPCGECGACRRLENHSSESVLLIAPEKNTIKLESAHLVLDFLSLQRVSAARMVIIDQAHLLSVQTANALLKAVEEPPPETFFILLTGEISQLLPTLRSRVQNLRLPTIAEPPDPALEPVRELARKFLSDAGRGQREALEEIQSQAKDREFSLQISRMMQQELREWTFANTDTARTELWQKAYRLELDVLANVDRPLLFENFFLRAREALS